MADARSILTTTVAAVVVAASMLFGASASPSPLGTWTTIDDETGKERAVVRIEEIDGKLRGTILELFPMEGEEPPYLCEACEGKLHKAPIIGFVLLWDLEPGGEGWVNGQILDPKNGRTYGCEMTLSADGQTLHVRGFLGISLFGRTQIWKRRS